MRIHLPRAAIIAALGCLALSGCVGVTKQSYTGTTSCPDLDPTAQQYMQGSAAAPVRCGPQAQNYWDPSVTTTGGKSSS